MYGIFRECIVNKSVRYKICTVRENVVILLPGRIKGF